MADLPAAAAASPAAEGHARIVPARAPTGLSPGWQAAHLLRRAPPTRERCSQDLIVWKVRAGGGLGWNASLAETHRVKLSDWWSQGVGQSDGRREKQALTLSSACQDSETRNWIERPGGKARRLEREGWLSRTGSQVGSSWGRGDRPKGYKDALLYARLVATPQGPLAQSDLDALPLRAQNHERAKWLRWAAARDGPGAPSPFVNTYSGGAGGAAASRRQPAASASAAAVSARGGAQLVPPPNSGRRY